MLGRIAKLPPVQPTCPGPSLPQWAFAAWSLINTWLYAMLDCREKVLRFFFGILTPRRLLRHTSKPDPPYKNKQNISRPLSLDSSYSAIGHFCYQKHIFLSRKSRINCSKHFHGNIRIIQNTCRNNDTLKNYVICFNIWNSSLGPRALLIKIWIWFYVSNDFIASS